MDNEKIAEELRSIAKSLVAKQDIDDMASSQLDNAVFDIIDADDEVMVGIEDSEPEKKKVKSVSVSPESVKIEVSDVPEIKLTKRKTEKLINGEREFKIKNRGKKIYLTILD